MKGNEGGNLGMMRLRRIALSFLPAALLGFSSQAFADNPPGGSYQQSCRNISASNGTLLAQCRTRGDGWPNTTLPNYHQCVGDISNQDGQLRCNRGAAPPGGSYTGSCRDIWIDQGTLHASCLERSGPWVYTFLQNVSQCRGDISNQDGQLRCDRGGPPPRGSYVSSCRDIWVDGDVLHASCSNGSGGWLPGAISAVGSCRGDIFNFNGALICNKTALPPGSYQQSCSGVWTNGDTLNALCRTGGGGTVTAQLTQISHCVPGSIENHSGALVCTHGNRAAPPGSYQQSCNPISMTDNTLSANCATGKPGGFVMSSNLDVRGCTGDIANIHGFLTCPKGNGPEPSGSYQKSCRDVVVAGTILNGLCETPQGVWLSTSLLNYQNCGGRIDNTNGKLTCPGSPGSPVPSPVGYAKLDVNNCNADVDAVGKHRSISVYLLDLNVSNGGYFLGAPMKTQYNENGSCPFDENGQPADPDTIDLVGHNASVNGHTFKVVIVDPLMQACEGQNNPLSDNCVRDTFTIKSNINGETFKYVAK